VGDYYQFNAQLCQFIKIYLILLETSLTKHLMKSTLTVGAMTMISRILGFVRDVLMARVLGADAATDAFFVAFKIPNFLRRLFAEGAFSQAFVPVLAEYKQQRPQELKRFIDETAGSLALTLMAVTIVGMLAAPVLIILFAPGFLREGYQYELAVDMLRITFPYLFFISLTAFAGGIFNTFDRFAIPAITPVFLNLCLIGAAVWWAPHWPEPTMALAWGVFAAGIVQWLFQWPGLWRLRLLPRMRYGFRSPGVKRIMSLMLPAIFGVSVTQVNLLLDTLIASLLVSGSVSWLYYSDRLVEFPLGVFGIALATVILPSLSKDHAADNPQAFSHSLDWGMRWVMLISLPAMSGLVLLAEPILRALFHHGEFTAHDVAMSARSLMAYSVGLLGFMLVKVLAPGFTARQDTKTPVRFGIIAMVANMGLNLVLMWPLAHAGLALATSLSAYLNAGLLLFRLRREHVYRPDRGWWLFSLRLLCANGVMTALLWAMTCSAWSSVLHRWGDTAFLLLAITAGALGYALALLASGFRVRQLLGREA